ncbi:hypothetical protein [Streptomyces sp. SID13588]|uniref:hypothetical protein n=1 Tax=Streptomyces sp. SID13588 TaxID=2706051 RepID=UPI0013CBD865|nr:hypothetical protein [Streptomyces sp. SID13588]NEA72782.1 hypothetical protein [Streptomyces sp. SID13588]
MSTQTDHTTGPDFEDIGRGDTLTADLPPQCHGKAMGDRTGAFDYLGAAAAAEMRADMAAGLIGRWHCWYCECEIYADAGGVVTEPPYDACDDHCTC